MVSHYGTQLLGRQYTVCLRIAVFSACAVVTTGKAVPNEANGKGGECPQGCADIL